MEVVTEINFRVIYLSVQRCFYDSKQKEGKIRVRKVQSNTRNRKEQVFLEPIAMVARDWPELVGVANRHAIRLKTHLEVGDFLRTTTHGVNRA